ncbi:hypothetical protein LZB55_08210, partial [Campylobacter lari]|nr:hypothetical protein [Campylobacter lari]
GGHIITHSRGDSPRAVAHAVIARGDAAPAPKATAASSGADIQDQRTRMNQHTGSASRGGKGKQRGIPAFRLSPAMHALVLALSAT